jgi:RNA polymerase sigma factor (sigma-70 family)
VPGIGGDVKDVRRLTSEIASGNPEAFARLYRARFAHMYAAARSATRFDEGACLDIVQDTMMRVIRYMKPFEDVRALDNWLTCVTRSVAYDHLRRERRRRARERNAVVGHTAVVVDDTQEIQERLDWVRRELRGLDRAAGAIIELRFRAGLTLEAIGRRLGIRAGAVHGRLTRAITRLRKRALEDE